MRYRGRAWVEQGNRGLGVWLWAMHRDDILNGGKMIPRMWKKSIGHGAHSCYHACA